MTRFGVVYEAAQAARLLGEYSSLAFGEPVVLVEPGLQCGDLGTPILGDARRLAQLAKFGVDGLQARFGVIRGAAQAL